MLYLDPHTTQQAVDTALAPDADTSSYRPPAVRRLHFSRLDPTIALAFYCESAAAVDELYRLCAASPEFAAAPLFSIQDVFVDYDLDLTLASSLASSAAGSSVFDSRLGDLEDPDMAEWEEL